MKIQILAFITGLLLLTHPLAAQYQISGNVRYDNDVLTYLDSVTVVLKQGSSIISQVSTNDYGHYVFTGIPAGTYTLTGYTNKIWGGCNSTDAVAILKHFVNLAPLTDIRLLAANVDNSAAVNTMDALMVSQRYIQLLDSFPAGNWVFQTRTLTLDGNRNNFTLLATCCGDVNASFTPPVHFTCGDTFTDSRDSQTYTTILIGEQCWMSKNMNIGTFIYGVGNQTNNQVIEKFCYQNNTTNCANYGGLYQWNEMMQYDTTPGGQGICPAEWHIPTDTEWDTLIYGLGGYSQAGTQLKVGGSSGFNGLLAGWVFSCQKFRQLTIQGFFWSSSNYYTLYGYDRILTWNSPGVSRVYTSVDDGLSVRCLKD